MRRASVSIAHSYDRAREDLSEDNGTTPDHDALGSLNSVQRQEIQETWKLLLEDRPGKGERR